MGNMVPEAGLASTLNMPQLSVAVTASQFTMPLHWSASEFSEKSLGRFWIFGFSLSSTLTVKVESVVLPDSSTAVSVTSVSPKLKVEPLSIEGVKLETEQLSEALAVHE